MQQTILTLQIPTKTKLALQKKASNKGYFNLSSYLRNLIEEDLDGDTKQQTNPWLQIADDISQTLSQTEINQSFNSIKKSRQSRSEKYWNNLSKSL